MPAQRQKSQLELQFRTGMEKMEYIVSPSHGATNAFQLLLARISVAYNLVIETSKPKRESAGP
jgi:hypothetical protein